MDHITQLGVGGIFVLMVLDRVFGFLRTKNGSGSTVQYGYPAEHCGFNKDRDEIRDLLKKIEFNTRGLKSSPPRSSP